jgi:hypothetical protein
MKNPSTVNRNASFPNLFFDKMNSALNVDFSATGLAVLFFLQLPS